MGLCQSKSEFKNVTPSSWESPPPGESSSSPSQSRRRRSSAAVRSSTLRPPEMFQDRYSLGKLLGEGAFGVVKEGTDKISDETVAVKIIPKSTMTVDERKSLTNEVDVLKSLRNHPNIITLIKAYDEPGSVYLVLEKMEGGELFDRIVKKTSYNEMEARDTCKILFEALDFIHRHNYAHRDLKPENLLLVSNDSDSKVKISDFGFAKKCRGPESLRTHCGTPSYMAPEIVERNNYDTRADMWSLGVIVFILLGGYPPFSGRDTMLFAKIKRGDWHFNEKYWDNVSDSAKDLIQQLLTVKPSMRLTSNKAIEHPWLTDTEEMHLEMHNLDANLGQFRIFNAKRKLRATVHAVNAAQRFTSRGSLSSSSGADDVTWKEGNDDPDEIDVENFQSVHPVMAKMKAAARAVLATSSGGIIPEIKEYP